MIHLLLAIIYLAFISLGLPDGLLGAAWPTMCLEMDVPVSYAGMISVTIACGTIVSSLLSDRLTLRFGTKIAYHFHKTDKGYGCFGKVGIFCGPVVHLKINIGVEVTSPRGIEIVTPYAL